MYLPRLINCLQNPNTKAKFSIPPNINGLGESESYNKLYDNFFQILYHQEPEFTNDVEGHQARSYICEATMLLQAAWYLDAVAAVRPHLESAYLRLNQVLWTHISSKPESWVQVAAKLESPLMFRESMLHLFGRYHLKDSVNMNTLTDPVYGVIGAKIAALVDKKARELKHLKITTERHLLEFYPKFMARNENAVAGKESYGKDIYLWMALSLIRQYISSAYPYKSIKANINRRLSRFNQRKQ